MDKNGIDDVLQKVSPELIKGYEEKNGLTETLKWANEGYKLETEERGKYWNLNILLAVMVAILVSALFVDALIFKSWWLAIVAAAVFLFWVCWVTVFTAKTEVARNKRINENELILCGFRQSVEALNPLASPENTVGYTNDSVHNTLVRLTADLLRSEGIFRAVCGPHNSTDTIVNYGISEQKCRKQRDDVLSAFEKFGVSYDRQAMEKLSRDAKRHLERIAEV